MLKSVFIIMAVASGAIAAQAQEESGNQATIRVKGKNINFTYEQCDKTKDPLCGEKAYKIKAALSADQAGCPTCATTVVEQVAGIESIDQLKTKVAPILEKYMSEETKPSETDEEKERKTTKIEECEFDEEAEDGPSAREIKSCFDAIRNSDLSKEDKLELLEENRSYLVSLMQSGGQGLFQAQAILNGFQNSKLPDFRAFAAGTFNEAVVNMEAQLQSSMASIQNNPNLASVSAPLIAQQIQTLSSLQGMGNQSLGSLNHLLANPNLKMSIADRSNLMNQFANSPLTYNPNSVYMLEQKNLLCLQQLSMNLGSAQTTPCQFETTASLSPAAQAAKAYFEQLSARASRTSEYSSTAPTYNPNAVQTLPGTSTIIDQTTIDPRISGDPHRGGGYRSSQIPTYQPQM